jgi:uncharacterized membrane protein
MEQHIETRAVHQRSVVGVFDHEADAERALEQLKELGIGGADVSLMMRDQAGEEPQGDTGGSPVTSGAASGAAIGGLLGGLAGWMIAIGAIGIPGIGTIVGAGALAAMLTGAAVGAAAGGLVGALLGLGIPEEEAKAYEAHVRAGRMLVTIHPSSSMDAARAQQLLQSNGAYDVRVYEAPPAHTHPLAPPVIEETPSVGEEEVAAPVVEEVVTSVGEASSETVSLGSGAEGGYGTGEVPRPEESARDLASGQEPTAEDVAAGQSDQGDEGPAAGDGTVSESSDKVSSDGER